MCVCDTIFETSVHLKLWEVSVQKFKKEANSTIFNLQSEW